MVKILVPGALLAAALSAAPVNYSPAEVAKHNKAGDCWLIIDRSVFNVTAYVNRHKGFDFDFTRYCGSDATAAWHKKPGSGKPHSRKAQRLLQRYLIGEVKQ